MPPFPIGPSISSSNLSKGYKIPCFLSHLTLYIQPLKMELIQGSETSANYNLTPGKYSEENIEYSNHGENLKSRIIVISFNFELFGYLSLFVLTLMLIFTPFLIIFICIECYVAHAPQLMLCSPRPTVSELVIFHLHLHQSSSSENFHLIRIASSFFVLEQSTRARAT